jgi:hypothetical protein
VEHAEALSESERGHDIAGEERQRQDRQEIRDEADEGGSAEDAGQTDARDREMRQHRLQADCSGRQRFALHVKRGRATAHRVPTGWTIRETLDRSRLRPRH